jgi:hypothetical protein
LLSNATCNRCFKVKQAFENIDRDRSGSVNSDELAWMVGRGLQSSTVLASTKLLYLLLALKETTEMPQLRPKSSI